MDILKKIDEKNYGSDYTTFPRTLEKYKWYKPILVAIITLIFVIIFNAILFITFIGFSGFDVQQLGQVLSGTSTDGAITNLSNIITLLTVVLIIPSIYISTKIVKDRPFSSYLTLGRKWDWGIFLKSMLIAFIVYMIIYSIEMIIMKEPIHNSFTIITFLLVLILTPIQCFAEELLCRGFIMQTFGSWFRIPIVAILLQTILFAAGHTYNMTGLLSVFITGLVYGIITWYSKGLEVSSALHSINNLFVFTIIGLGLTTVTHDVSYISLFEGFILLILSVGAILLIDKKFNWIRLIEQPHLVEGEDS
ncbi:CPBP family intramembrane glutamic endopeptidase [uncultured Methanobrevibacter sp.]|uniref:CPBP family intramembrane glutamic endopeptidase n=1 Tax=uncultured Methanobrevibacter sp. TaxID=253161 RepID=UPI0025CE8417|nr:CPBP family intramembrane glutamic endopeptidase [uncultured Methanobrevibacter sp.]